MRNISYSFNPKVSVIIPTYNRGWIVKKAIDSVIQQDYSNFELIIIDDGSTDNTSKIIKSYGSKLNLIKQKNSGVSYARNVGIKAASGQLIAFLDSDDEWLHGKLSAQIKFFLAHPNALICQTQESWIRNGKKINQEKQHKKISGMIFEHCLTLCLVSPSAVMMKKILFDQIGLFDEKLPACEDYDFWLRISWKYPIFLIDQILTIKHGGHTDQLSQMPQLDKFRIYSIKKIIKNAKLSKNQRLAAINVLIEKCKIYASGCIKYGKIKEARTYLNIADCIK